MNKINFLKLRQALPSKKIIVLLVGLVLLGGIIFYFWKEQQPSTLNNNITETTNEADQTNLSSAMHELRTLEKVEALIQEKSSNGEPLDVRAIELEEEHGSYMYKLYMADGSVLFMNARTGTTSTRPFIDSSSNSGDSDHSLRVPADFNAGITIMQARDFAIAEHPDAFIEKIELSMEEGVAVYSVRFLDDARIDVNANNGTIERTEPADNDRDDFRVRESTETESHGDSKIDDKSDDRRDDSFEDNPSRRGSDDS